ncbi:MAG: tRNA (adenosine(37)-N6)-threonylcarbamoyltransferase complex ATPase subunit type 1 TsaE [Pseudomonadota bacterium]
MPVFSASEKETEDLGRRLASILRAGDCVTFTGDLGAGKTTLVRALIRARAGAPIDVPSPTYALVEAYEFETPIFHVDLYRLENQAEAWELGLDDMFETGITLVEWPDRAEELLPAARLEITISHRDEGRDIAWRPLGTEWTERMAHWEST